MDKNIPIKNNSKSRRGFLLDITKWISGTALLTAAANIFTSGKIKADTSSANGTDVFVGEIISFGCNFAPRGYTFCNGQLLQISQNTALFSLLGTTFGGDGRTTMGVPDLQGRVAVGVGTGPGLSNITWGEKGGVHEVTLGNTQIPNHSHSLRVDKNYPNSDNPDGKYISADSEGIAHYSSFGTDTANSNSIENSGGGDAHNNMMPYLCIYQCIAVTGAFPSRS